MVRTKEILTTAGTLACAIGIGFVMQNSDVAEQRYGKLSKDQKQDQFVQEMSDTMLDMQDITLTSAEFETSVSLPSTDPQVAKVAAPQILPEPKIPEVAIAPSCEIVANARPIAAALVELTMDASCLPNERVTVHHNGMIFTQTTSANGTLNLTVPALAQEAMFIIAFSNGEGAVAQTVVEDLQDYDRVVLQWKGQTGFQIHAREFGADYGQPGHVWEGTPGEIADVVTGTGGYLSLLGDTEAPEALLAEVYSFPVAATDRAGSVTLSVETEVSDLNCGLELEAQTLQVLKGDQMKTRNLTLSVPDCESTGDFLVLNNLLQDLKVASK